MKNIIERILRKLKLKKLVVLIIDYPRGVVTKHWAKGADVYRFRLRDYFVYMDFNNEKVEWKRIK